MEIRARRALEPKLGKPLVRVPEVFSAIIDLSHYDALVTEGARP